MSPTDPRSWTQLLKPAVKPQARHHMGTNHRATDADDTEYRGVPISRNMPVVGQGRAFDGNGSGMGMINYTF